MKAWRSLTINIILMTVFILIMGTINLRVNGIEVKETFFILPVLLGVLFGGVVTFLSLRRARDFKERISEKTRELEYYATMDDMTNTYNRRMGLELLKNHYTLSRRGGRSLSVCFVDIDGLKTVNDNYGHMSGDRLIEDISEILKSSVRESDIVARMGGDEFLVVLPECGIEGAAKVMKRVEGRIALYNEISSRGYRASVSYGIAESSGENKESVEKLLMEADNRMYSMKRQMKKSLFRGKISSEKLKGSS